MTRGIALAAAPGEVSMMDFLLDIICIKPQYGLGWYLNYLFIWYVIFSVYQLLRQRYGKKAIVALIAASVISFFISPTELQAEQSLSFLTGILLSEYKESGILARLKAQSLMVIAAAFLIGAAAFVLKQIRILEFPYWIYLLQLIYKYGWAVMLMMVLWRLLQRFPLRSVGFIGKYSYEIYLIHGYMWGLMKSIATIPVFILGVSVASLGLHHAMELVRRKVLKKYL